MSKIRSFLATLWRKTDKRGKIDVMGFKCALPVSIVAAVMCLPPVASAQSKQIKDLGVGKLLVAPRDCPDPNFARRSFCWCSSMKMAPWA